MLVAIMSDSHDHLGNIDKAMKICVDEKVDAIIHCGDIISPFSLKKIGEPGIPVHAVFGNNDGDRVKLVHYSRTILKHIDFADMVGEVEIDNIKIAYTHYFEIAEKFAKSGEYDLVCFGHSHKRYCKKNDRIILLNPGEVMGKGGFPGFVLFNTENLEILEVNLK